MSKRRREGDVVEIDLGEDLHAYARVLPNATFAFYDCIGKATKALEEILAAPILFKVPVMRRAVTSGRWRIIGSSPLSPELLEHPAFFIQDALNLAHFEISIGGKTRPASREECQGLERLAVWSANHIEDRLRDVHAGRPNKWVESLRIRNDR
jgi:hypothetical protein